MKSFHYFHSTISPVILIIVEDKKEDCRISLSIVRGKRFLWNENFERNKGKFCNNIFEERKAIYSRATKREGEGGLKEERKKRRKKQLKRKFSYNIAPNHKMRHVYYHSEKSHKSQKSLLFN